MPLQSRYRYNVAAGRYTLNGRFVTNAAVRSALERTLVATNRAASTLATRLAAGEVSLMEWERLMRELIKDVHLYSRALARGGWARMSASDFGKAGAEIKKQYAYLNRFAAEISTGYNLESKIFPMRVSMYMNAGRRSFYQAKDDEMLDIGMTEERNIRHAADSCNGCIEATAMGWVPIGTLPDIGDRDCLTNCLCDKEYR